MLEPLFIKFAGLTPVLKNICRLLVLYCTRTTRCYLSILLYIQFVCLYLYVCLSLKFKRFQRIWIRYLIFTKSLLSVLFAFSMFFLSFSVLFHFLMPQLIKRILLSWELIKIFLPPLTSLKYVHVSK